MLETVVFVIIVLVFVLAAAAFVGRQEKDPETFDRATEKTITSLFVAFVVLHRVYRIIWFVALAALAVYGAHLYFKIP